MTFAEPHWLWALALVPLGLLALARAGRRAGSSGDEPDHGDWLWVDARGVRPLPPRRRRRWPGLWAALAVALGVLALAQPQWGSRESVQFDQAREVLIALDLSRSMLAQDVPPSRLARARLLIESTLDELAGERVGLLLFAGTAFLQSPLSADHEVLREVLPVLEPGYLPQGGTDFEAMIAAALEAFSQTGAADRYLVVLSDGESEAFDEASIEALREAGVRVIALGIGTEAGALIPDDGRGIVKDDRGAAVLSRLEREPLERLAAETGGVYVDAASWLDLAGLVESTVAQGRTGEFVERREKRAVHRFQWFLAPAVLALLLSHLFELPAMPRARTLHARSPEPANERGDWVWSSDEASASANRASTGPARAHSRAAGVGLVLLASAWTWGLGTPASASEPPPPPSDPIVESVARLVESPSASAGDYAELASATLEVGLAQQGAGVALADGVVRDGLVAVAVGERIDPRAADWAALRSGLESLLQDGPPPPDTGEGEGDGQGEEEGQPQGGGQTQDGSGGEQGGEQEPQQGESGESQASDSSTGEQAGEPGEAGSSDASDDEAAGGSSSADAPEADEEGGGSRERERGNPQALTDADAGFGNLGEEAADEAGDEADPGHENEQAEGGASETAGESEAEAESESRPSRLVGGTRSANDELIHERPDLAAAVGRMERVRDGDAPAVLFDRMNTAEGNVDQDGGSRW